MNLEEEILKELKYHTVLMERELSTLTEIKFELQNARVMSESTYTIKVRQSWLDRIKEILKRS